MLFNINLAFMMSKQAVRSPTLVALKSLNSLFHYKKQTSNMKSILEQDRIGPPSSPFPPPTPKRVQETLFSN